MPAAISSPRVSAADVCTVAGPITFTAEDQDKAPSAPVTANCPPPGAAGGGDGGSPIAASAEAFAGTWNMRMSDGVGYVLILEVDGDKVNGTFRSPGRRLLDGTVAGSLPRSKKGRFEYTFSQPGTGLSSFGIMTVHEDGTLNGTLDEASDGKSYTWTGKRAGAGDGAAGDEAAAGAGADEGAAKEDVATEPPAEDVRRCRRRRRAQPASDRICRHLGHAQSERNAVYPDARRARRPRHRKIHYARPAEE